MHPTRPSEITPEWLTQVLRSEGLVEDGGITDIGVEIIGEERGFTGVIARIEIAYDGPVDGAPGSIVAKFPLAERPADSSYRRAQGGASEVSPVMMQRALREAEFYAFAGGDLSALPGCYFSHFDIEGGEALLLLEDLSGGVPGDALTGCTVDEARSVLAAIGRVHARWWRDSSLSKLGWLVDWADANQRRAERFRAQADFVTQTFAERLPAPIIAVLLDLVDSFDEILAELAGAPQTLVHGDMHLDNVIFEPEPDTLAVRLIDWQGPSVGPAVLDIAGFLAESVMIEERRTHESQLLREYHQGLVEGGVDSYSTARLYDDYRRALTVRAVGQVGWLARVIDHPPAGRERDLVEALFDPGRVFVALLDHFDDDFPRQA